MTAAHKALVSDKQLQQGGSSLHAHHHSSHCKRMIEDMCRSTGINLVHLHNILTQSFSFLTVSTPQFNPRYVPAKHPASAQQDIQLPCPKFYQISNKNL